MASPTPTFGFTAFDLGSIFSWLMQLILYVFVIALLFGVANALKTQILKAI